MEKDFYLIESSMWSDNGFINPEVHGVVYSTKDTLALKVLAFLQKHVMHVQETNFDELNAVYLTEDYVDARMVEALKAVCGMQEDLSFYCPEWATSYRIRKIHVSPQQWRSLPEFPNPKVILGMEFAQCPDGDKYDFATINPTVRPENEPAEDRKENEAEYDEMKLSLDELSTEGYSW